GQRRRPAGRPLAHRRQGDLARVSLRQNFAPNERLDRVAQDADAAVLKANAARLKTDIAWLGYPSFAHSKIPR
ncbi:MAG: hypothetical protein ACK4JD_09430, partial [Thermoflexales bacterium]